MQTSVTRHAFSPVVLKLETREDYDALMACIGIAREIVDGRVVHAVEISKKYPYGWARPHDIIDLLNNPEVEV